MYYRYYTIGRTKFSSFESHHFFTGMILCLIGFVMIFFNLSMNGWYEWLVIFLLGFGGWLMIDDVVQHYIQRKELQEYGKYFTITFWHWFPYLILYKITKKAKYREEFGGSGKI